MAVNTLNLAELRGLPDDERLNRLAAFVKARQEPMNGEMHFLNECIGEFETRYEMSSATMLDRLRSKQIPETGDICKWLMLIDARKSLVTPTP
jgi:hypothetical protein